MVDTVKTRSQLINQALFNIGQIEPGETPAPEDYDTMDGLVDPIVAQLAANQIAYIQDPDAIDLAFFLTLASYLANMAGPRFGSPINQDVKLQDEQTFRRMTTAVPTKETLKAVYF